MSETKKEKLIEVNGLVIKTNSVYKITNKVDNNAPDGFVREGTTKLPSEGIGNTVPCKFHVTNKAKGTGVFDTGFYLGSPCYSMQEKSEIESKVKALTKSIVDPYEKKYGAKILDHKNEEFWVDFGVDLFSGRYFVTSNVDDLLELYIAMSAFELTPKELIGNPKFSNSQYCIEDKEKVQTVKSERANNMIEVISKFGVMLSDDRETLINVLRYIRLLGVSDTIDTATLNGLFFEWLQKSTENPEIFKNAYELTQSDSTKDVVNLYVIASRLANKKKLEKVGNEYTYKGEVLGADLKTVAKNVNSKPELGEIKIEFIEMD